MEYVFRELPAFERHRKDYFDDEQFRAFQNHLAANPKSGPIIRGAGGLRKIRWTDPRRGKGKRSGTRVIYYLHHHLNQFWLFTVYDKDMLDDLSPEELAALKVSVQREIKEAQNERA